MKKFILLIAIGFIANLGLKAQNAEGTSLNTVGTSEIRLNTLYLLLGNFEGTYEHLINDYSGLGFTGTVNMDNNTIMDLNYMFMPYYRLYTGEDADELFFEGGFAFYNQKISSFNPRTMNSSQINQISYGPSLALGRKRVYDNNITLETYFGICRNYNTTSDAGNLLYPRFGISLGKRF